VGRYREARQLIDAAAKYYDSVGNIADAGALHLLSSVLAIEQQDYVLARQHLRRARALFAPLPPALLRINLAAADLVSGLVEVRAGQMKEALSALESQQRSYRLNLPIEKWWHAALEGEIRMASRDFSAAAAAFASGEPSHRVVGVDTPFVSILFNGPMLRDGAARVAKARGDLAGAIEIYRQLLTYGPRQKWYAAFEPRYVLERARLLDQHGESEAARQEYRRFLELWKHADSDLPELKEARRAVPLTAVLDSTAAIHR
jgi:tetratricopeptide (TPR) repeat protein